MIFDMIVYAYLLPYDMKPYFLYDIIDNDVFHPEEDFFPVRLFDYKIFRKIPFDNHIFSNANYTFHRHIENMYIHNDFQIDSVDIELEREKDFISMNIFRWKTYSSSNLIVEYMYDEEESFVGLD